MRLAKRPCAIAKAVVTLTLTATSVQANIIYSFAGTGSPSTPVAFHLTVPDVVTAPLDHSGLFVFFTCAQFDSSTNCDPAGVTSFSNQSVLGSFSAQLTFPAIDGISYAYFFQTGAFAVTGAYHSGGVGFPGTLTVTDTNDPTEVPEPDSTMFVWSGVCLCGLSFRLRSRR